MYVLTDNVWVSEYHTIMQFKQLCSENNMAGNNFYWLKQDQI